MTKEEFQKYVVGKNFAHVEQKAKALGYIVRVSWSNGEPFYLTADYCPDRLNLKVSNGFVEGIDNWS